MNQVVRYGVIGAGGIAQRRVMPAFANTNHSVLAAICSRSLDRASALAKQFQAAGAFDDVGEMWNLVDAVYLASPVHCHLEDARKILTAGKHLLIEKPLACTSGEAREIQNLCEHAGVFAMEAYMMKFHPAHVAIREAVCAGALGQIVHARARLGCWYPDIPDAWRQNPNLSGGGALMDLGSHLIDLLKWILGPIRSVLALCTTQLFSYPVEDSATVLLEFEAGTHGVVEAFFSMPDQVGTGLLELTGTRGRVTAYETIGQNGGGHVRWETFPSQAEYDARQTGSTQDVEDRTMTYPPTNLYAAQLDAFSLCVLNQTSPTMNNLAEGIETLQWIELAYQQPES